MLFLLQKSFEIFMSLNWIEDSAQPTPEFVWIFITWEIIEKSRDDFVYLFD